MSSHEYFRELGALASIGQISADEERALKEHIAQCQDCRAACSDYASILMNHLPNVDSERYRQKGQFVHPSSNNDIRDRFLARARSAGAAFSPEVESPKASRRSSLWEIHLNRLLWAGTLAAICGVAAYIVIAPKFAGRPDHSPEAALLKENNLLRVELEQSRQSAASVAQENQVTAQEALQARTQLAVLQDQLQQLENKSLALNARWNDAQLANQALAAKSRNDQAAIVSLQARLSNERSNSASALAMLVDAQDRIKTLRRNLDDDSERLAMQQQMASVSSDVRALMGARNLHIIDVHDVTESGKTKKAFGRVFYAEGKALVFYAFDLPTKGSSAKYFFNTWAQQEGNVRSIRNLGTLAIDDHAQHRWVLKVNNPALLKGIDSLFVTAEAVRDSSAPRGRRILYAFLAGRPNHP